MHIINLILITRLADWLNERTFVAMLQCIWTLPCVLALCFWPGIIADKWGTYALVLVITSYPYCRKSTPKRFHTTPIPSSHPTHR